MEIESPFDLLGLFHGVSIDKKSVMDLPRMPNMVFLYRRPCWTTGPSKETLGDLVTHVLVHEIGHHFGLSDADMEHIEAAVGRLSDATLSHRPSVFGTHAVANAAGNGQMLGHWESSAAE